MSKTGSRAETQRSALSADQRRERKRRNQRLTRTEKNPQLALEKGWHQDPQFCAGLFDRCEHQALVHTPGFLDLALRSVEVAEGQRRSPSREPQPRHPRPRPPGALRLLLRARSSTVIAPGSGLLPELSRQFLPPPGRPVGGMPEGLRGVGGFHPLSLGVRRGSRRRRLWPPLLTALDRPPLRRRS